MSSKSCMTRCTAFLVSLLLLFAQGSSMALSEGEVHPPDGAFPWRGIWLTLLSVAETRQGVELAFDVSKLSAAEQDAFPYETKLRGPDNATEYAFEQIMPSMTPGTLYALYALPEGVRAADCRLFIATDVATSWTTLYLADFLGQARPILQSSTPDGALDWFLWEGQRVYVLSVLTEPGNAPDGLFRISVLVDYANAMLTEAQPEALAQGMKLRDAVTKEDFFPYESDDETAGLRKWVHFALPSDTTAA